MMAVEHFSKEKEVLKEQEEAMTKMINERFKILTDNVSKETMVRLEAHKQLEDALGSDVPSLQSQIKQLSSLR